MNHPEQIELLRRQLADVEQKLECKCENLERQLEMANNILKKVTDFRHGPITDDCSASVGIGHFLNSN